MTQDRYTIRRLWRKGWWRCEDTEHGMTFDWLEHHFNDQNEARMSEECRKAISKEAQPELLIAQWLQEMGDWLRENHPEKVF